ncbi:cellulose synthase-like protein G2 [Aristolochia californica]|uniref:cellulose synthase-like protein G2 n=1 Tax=Aristolochia californica TaxID=171875 RepID=UPI0035E11D33
MYCNDPNSARQAMCFHLDPKESPSLAFVQFPQTMHSISPSDIYDGSLKVPCKLWWKGSDSLGGPILSGTGFYMKRDALYDTKQKYSKGRGQFMTSSDILQLRQRIGPSHLLIAEILKQYEQNTINALLSKGPVLKEAHLIASCSYEAETKWGEEVGFLYGSVVEDYFTGFNLHCGGLQSAYCLPQKAPFLGSAPTNFSDCLLQSKRWAAGLLQVAFSRSCPLIYGTRKINVLLRMCYAYFAFMPLSSLFVLCYALVPPLCLLNGVSLFPKASTPWFLVFIGTHILCVVHSMWEIFTIDGSIELWWSSERMWMMRSASSYMFGLLSVAMKLIGMSQIDFEITNKVTDEKQIERYTMGIFDFQGGGALLFPLIIVAMVNLGCLIGGIWRVVVEASYDALLAQVLLASLAVAASYPIIEGLFVRKDEGRIPISAALAPLMLSVVIVGCGYLIFSL